MCSSAHLRVLWMRVCPRTDTRHVVLSDGNIRLILRKIFYTDPFQSSTAKCPKNDHSRGVIFASQGMSKNTLGQRLFRCLWLYVSALSSTIRNATRWLNSLYQLTCQLDFCSLYLQTRSPCYPELKRQMDGLKSRAEYLASTTDHRVVAQVKLNVQVAQMGAG